MGPRFDVIVVGAGPAGSAAACAAAEMGSRTLLLEKERMDGPAGRYKACGGALEQSFLNALNVPEELVSRRVSRLELHHASGDTYVKVGAGAVLWRGVFDKFLADLAVQKGVHLHHCESVRSVAKIASRPVLYEVTSERGAYQAPYIVAADGVGSKTLRSLGWPGFRPQDLVATVTREVKTPKAQIDEILGEDKLHLFFGVKHLIPMGYAWVFPKEDMVSVGWGCRIPWLGRMGSGIQTFLENPHVKRILAEGRTLLKKSHLVPVGLRSRIAHEQVLGAGDAVGFVDPLTGKGIPYAFLSGRVAGECVGKAVQTATPLGLEETYLASVRELFLDSLEIKRKMLEQVYACDDHLRTFLELWQHHRSSEIFQKGLFKPNQTAARSEDSPGTGDALL